MVRWEVQAGVTSSHLGVHLIYQKKVQIYKKFKLKAIEIVACDLEPPTQTTTPSVPHLSRPIDFGASRWGQSEN